MNHFSCNLHEIATECTCLKYAPSPSNKTAKCFEFFKILLKHLAISIAISIISCITCLGFNFSIDYECNHQLLKALPQAYIKTLCRCKCEVHRCCWWACRTWHRSFHSTPQLIKLFNKLKNFETRLTFYSTIDSSAMCFLIFDHSQ